MAKMKKGGKGSRKKKSRTARKAKRTPKRVAKKRQAKKRTQKKRRKTVKKAPAKKTPAKKSPEKKVKKKSSKKAAPRTTPAGKFKRRRASRGGASAKSKRVKVTPAVTRGSNTTKAKKTSPAVTRSSKKGKAKASPPKNKQTKPAAKKARKGVVQRRKRGKTPRKARAKVVKEPEPESEEEEIFEVEKVVQMRWTKKKGTEFRIKWVGYTPLNNTWEPKDNLTGCEEALEDFYEQHEFVVERIMNEKTKNGVLYYFVQWEGYPPEENTWEPAAQLTSAQKAIKKYKEEKYNEKRAAAARKQKPGPASSKKLRRSGRKPKKPRRDPVILMEAQGLSWAREDTLPPVVEGDEETVITDSSLPSSPFHA